VKLKVWSSSLEKYFNFSVQLLSRRKAFGLIRSLRCHVCHSDYSARCAARYFQIPISNRRSFYNNSAKSAVVQPRETLLSLFKLREQNLILSVLYRLSRMLTFGDHCYKHLNKLHIYAQKKIYVQKKKKPYAIIKN
jgi:hypothetical protein